MPEKNNKSKSENKNQNLNKSNNYKTRRYKTNYNNVMISVVVPLLNEEESLPELSLILEDELKSIAGKNWEVLFVDDGSTDNSYNVIKEINKRNNNFRAIRFRRNYGKSAALAVGFEKAKGRYIATMDADLQDDPCELKNMLEKMNEGYDLVSGWKKKRHDPISKTIPSKLFNYTTSLVSGIKLHDFNCGLKLYKREVAKSLEVYGEMHRYLPALAYWNGFKIAEIPVQHHPRRYGKTKFGMARFINGFLDLITIMFTNRYVKRPMHFFGSVGTILALAGLIINAYLTFEWVMGNTYLSNRPLALLGIALIIVGVQFFSIGLLGELLVKNNLSNKNYVIKERL